MTTKDKPMLQDDEIFKIFRGPPIHIERITTALQEYIKKIEEMKVAKSRLLTTMVDLCPKDWAILSQIKIYLEDQSTLWSLIECDLRPLFTLLKKYGDLNQKAETSLREFEVRLLQVKKLSEEYKLMKRFSRVTTTQQFQIEYMLRESGRALAETRKTVEDVLLTFKKSKSELGAQLLTKFEAVHRTTCEENALVSNLIEEALKSVPAKKLNLDHKPVDDVNFVMNLVQLVVDKVNDVSVDLGSKEDLYRQLQDEYRKASSQTSDHTRQPSQSPGDSHQKTSPGMVCYDATRGPCYKSSITISTPAGSSRTEGPAKQQEQRPSRLMSPATQQQDQISSASRPADSAREPSRSSRNVSPATRQDERSRSSRPVDTAHDPSRSSRTASPTTGQNQRYIPPRTLSPTHESSKSPSPASPATPQDQRRPSQLVSTEHEASSPLRRTAYRTRQQDQHCKPPRPVSPAYEAGRSSRPPSPATQQGQQYKSSLIVSASHEPNKSTRTASSPARQDKPSRPPCPLNTTYQISTSPKSTIPVNLQDKCGRASSPANTSNTSTLSPRAGTQQDQDCKSSRTTYKTIKSFTINTGPAAQYDQGCRPSSPVSPEHGPSGSTRTVSPANRQEQDFKPSRPLSPTFESNRSSRNASPVTQQDQPTSTRPSSHVSPKYEANISSSTASQGQNNRTSQKSVPNVCKVKLSQVSTAQVKMSPGTGSPTVSPAANPESPQCQDGKGRSHRVVTIVQEPFYDKHTNSRPNISGPFKEYSFDLPERAPRRKNKIHPQICEEHAFCYGYGLHITVYNERRKPNGIIFEDGMP